MFDFARFAQDHRIHYITEGHHHVHRGWYQLHCPVCTDGRHGYHLGCSTTTGAFSCWRCGPLKQVDVVQGLLRCARERAYEVLRSYRGKDPQPRHRASRTRHKAVPPRDLGPLTEKHFKYLTDPLGKGRGFTRSRAEEIVATWGLQGTRHLSGPWSWRIVGTVMDVEARPLAYVGRAIRQDAKPKYRVTDEPDCAADPRGFLYGIQKVVGRTVIVVEGAGDAWNLGPGAVATLGIDWKEEQATQLRRFTHRVIAYDPEPKAQARAEELAQWLSVYEGETTILYDLPSDPGSLDENTVRRIRSKFLGDH